jgi:hypothetical protein
MLKGTNYIQLNEECMRDAVEMYLKAQLKDGSGVRVESVEYAKGELYTDGAMFKITLSREPKTLGILPAADLEG